MAWNINDLRAANPWSKDYTDDELISYTAQRLGTTPDALMGRIGYERDKPFTSDAYEVGRQVVNGVTQAAGMVNKAGAMFMPAGSKAEQMFADNAAYWDERSHALRPEMAGRGPVAGLLIKGAQALPPSAVAMGATALNPALGAVATVGGFGGSQAWDTYTKGLQAGLDPATAKRAALQAGAVEGGGEFLADVTGAKLLTGAGRGLNMLRKGGVEAAVKTATDPRWVARAAGSLAANAGIQSGTEYAQNYGETAIENAYGISNEDPHRAGMEGFEGGLGLSMLLSPFGAHAHRRAGIHRGVTRDLLNSTDGDLSRNVSAAQSVRSQITGTVGAPAADQWYADHMGNINDQRVATYSGEQAAALEAARNEQAAQAMGFPDFASYEAWAAQNQAPPTIRTNERLGMAPEPAVPPGVVARRGSPMQFNNTSPDIPVTGPLANITPDGESVDLLGMTARSRNKPATSTVSFNNTSPAEPITGALSNWTPNGEQVGMFDPGVDRLGLTANARDTAAASPIPFNRSGVDGAITGPLGNWTPSTAQPELFGHGVDALGMTAGARNTEASDPIRFSGNLDAPVVGATRPQDVRVDALGMPLEAYRHPAATPITFNNTSPSTPVAAPSQQPQPAKQEPKAKPAKEAKQPKEKAPKVAPQALGKAAQAVEDTINEYVASGRLAQDDPIVTEWNNGNAKTGKRAVEIGKRLQEHYNAAMNAGRNTASNGMTDEQRLAAGHVRKVGADGAVSWEVPAQQETVTKEKKQDDDTEQVSPDDVEDKDHAEAIRMFQAGDSLRTIAEALGMSHQHWKNVLKKYGHTEARRAAEAAAQAETGHTSTEDAALDGVDTEAVAQPEDIGDDEEVASEDRDLENAGITVRHAPNSGAATAATTDKRTTQEINRAISKFDSAVVEEAKESLRTYGMSYESLLPQQKIKALELAQQGAILESDVEDIADIAKALRNKSGTTKLDEQTEAQKTAERLAQAAKEADDAVEKIILGDTAAAVRSLELMDGEFGAQIRRRLIDAYGLPERYNSRQIVEYFAGLYTEVQNKLKPKLEEAATIWGDGFDKLTPEQQHDFVATLEQLGDLKYDVRVVRKIKEDINGGTERGSEGAGKIEAERTTRGVEATPAGERVDPDAGDRQGQPDQSGVRAPVIKTKKRRTLQRPVDGEVAPDVPTSLSRALDSDGGEAAPVVIDRNDAEAVIDRVMDGLPNAPKVTLVDRYDELPQQVRDEAESQGAGESDFKGALKNGHIWVLRSNHSTADDVEATMFHELYGHHGTRALFGKDWNANVRALFLKLGGWPGIRAIAEARGIDLSDYFDGVQNLAPKYRHLAPHVMVEELLAHIAEQKPKFADRVKQLVGQFREWLRQHKFAELAEYGETDVLHILSEAAKAVRTGKTVASNPGLTVLSRTLTQAAADFADRYPDGRRLVDDTSGIVKKVANHLQFLPDLVNSVKDRLPSAAKWYASVQQTAVDRRKMQEDAEQIATEAAALSLHDQDAMNQFIAKSTVEQKWGYDAEFKNADGTSKRVTADPAMAAEFRKLSPAAQKIVKDVFAHGEKMARTKFEILKSMGLDGVLDPSVGKLDGPYAPLKRFGKYIGVAKSKELFDAETQLKAAIDAGGSTKALEEKIAALKADPAHYLTPHFDTLGQAKEFAREVQGYHVADAFEKSHQITEGRPLKEGTLEKVLAAVRADVGNLPAGARASIEEMVRDLYFTSMDEHHARMSGLKRKNHAGYDKDMIRSFLAHARAEAAFLAQLKHGAETNEAFYAMQREVKGPDGKRDVQDKFNAIADHYAENLKYQETPIQDRLMTMATVWQLAMSPAYHLANSLQTVMVALPKMAADFNDYAGAWRHVRAGYNLLRGNWGSDFDISKVTDARLRDVLQTAAENNVLDVGLDENLAQFESTRTGYGPVDKASLVAKKAVHLLRRVSRSVELANRVSTGAAAYNLAKEKGMSHEDAKAYAIRTLQTTQGDTTRANKPLVLKKLPKFMGQYRGYQMMMAALYAKGFKDAFAGESATTRAIGRRFLAYKLGHTAIASGVMGMPLMPVFSLVTAALSAMFGDGDDDEPFDTERALRDAIGDDDLAGLVLHGPLGLLGIDMSAKLSEANVFMPMRPQDIDLTSRDGVTKTAFSLLGPAAGQLANFADGVHKIRQGDYYKGLERMAPSGIAQAMAASRIANEGYTLTNGDVMVKPEDISEFSKALEFLGMPSGEVRRIKWLRGQQYEIEQYYTTQTRTLERHYAEAYRNGDSDQLSELQADWMALQNGKDNLRRYFADSPDALKRQPLSNLLKYPSTAAKRERKLQATVAD